MKRMTLQQMIDERHRIAETLTEAMSDGTDMSMTKYAKLNERYHWLDERIRRKHGKDS
ncbi:hypothetical protein LCGC14_0346420 [marine sediment metagenome]|uniref:Uncharacterized protein n=1 Tax=marine sediment metagenome TaxID=412755 RepID=A0A0F9TCA6_9ZZZZ